MKPVVILYALAACGLVLAGCRGIPAPGEKQARRDLGTVANQYRPGNRPASLPELTPDSSLSNLVSLCAVEPPRLEAAYYDWSASVENITVMRSLPDPQLTFQSYIQDTLTSLMPGFMQQFPGPGKLKTRAGVAAAESQTKYFAFESAVLQTAFDLETRILPAWVVGRTASPQARGAFIAGKSGARSPRSKRGWHGIIAGIAARPKRTGSRRHRPRQSGGFAQFAAGKFQGRAGLDAAAARSPHARAF